MYRIESIKKAQDSIGVDNKYKEYFINNKEYIRRLLAVNKDVSTVDEAMILIKQIDFRDIFELDVLMEKAFICKFMYKEEYKSFAFKTKKEADKTVEKEIAKYTGKKVFISSYERFGSNWINKKICVRNPDFLIILQTCIYKNIQYICIADILNIRK